MIITPLRYIFTGNWAFTPSVVDIKDIAFCKSLFDNPDITTSGNANVNLGGISMGTFFIAAQIPNTIANNENELVTINAQQLILITNNIDHVSSVMEKLKNKLIELNPTQFDFSFLTSSLAIDSEISDFIEDDKISSEWLSEKFINKNILLIDNFKSSKTHVADIMFVIENEDKRKITIQIQPRTSDTTGLFVKIIESFDLANNRNIQLGVGERIEKLQEEAYDQINKIVSDNE